MEVQFPMTQDLKCPSCSSDNTQRLSVMYSQQSVKGTVGSGQTALAASLQKPKAPWATTLGFLAALITIPISRAIFGPDNPALGLLFIVAWVGVWYWIHEGYASKLRKWQNTLDENFMCLRCGTTFTP
jgi:hypothetical protein